MIAKEKIQISNPKALSGGLYSVYEASLYSMVSVRTLKRWYLGDARSKNIIDGESLIEDGRFISFHDLIQVLGIRELKTNYGISLQKIREAVEWVFKETGIKYPFARRHHIFYDGKQLFFQFNDSEDLIQITSPNIDQFTMKQLIQYYLKELDFNDEGYAIQYRPQKGILLDPTMKFGEPILEKYGVTAFTLYDSVLSEGNFESVSELFEIEIADVIMAYKYIDTLKSAA